jgi:hypothetical protein
MLHEYTERLYLPAAGVEGEAEGETDGAGADGAPADGAPAESAQEAEVSQG